MEDAYFIKQILAFLVYVGGFAAIPFMAKRFGGVLGSLTGMVNDRSKGLIDRPRNWLRGLAADRRKGRHEAQQQERRSRITGMPKPKTLNPLKKTGWKEGWRTRAQLAVGLRDSATRFRAGGQIRYKNFVAEKPPLDRESGQGVEEAPQQAGIFKRWNDARQARRMSGREGEGWRQRRATRRETVHEIIGSKVGAVVIKENKEAGEQITHTLGGKNWDQLKTVVYDQTKSVAVRQAALGKLVQEGAVAPVREILGRAHEVQEAESVNSLLPQMVVNLRKGDAFYKPFRETAPDIAVAAVDEVNMTVRARPSKKFLYDQKADKVMAWDDETWRDLDALPDDYEEEKVAGKTRTGAEIKQHIFDTQGVEILLTARGRSRTSPSIQALILKNMSQKVKEDNRLDRLENRILGIEAEDSQQEENDI